MVQHKLKTWPVYFDAIALGEKPFEVRRDDRGFQKGDVLVLQRTREDNLHMVEFDLQGKAVKELRRRVTYVLTGGQFGIEPGFVVLGLSEIDADKGGRW